MLVMSQHDVDRYLAELPRTVAKDLDIENYDFLDLIELGDAIFGKKPEAFVKLDNFVKVYRKWWNFQLEKKHDVELGRLKQSDFEHILDLQKKRDDARIALINEVRAK